MARKWRVSLINQHAQCGIFAEGRTRREAFNAAFKRAGPTHRHHGLVRDGNPPAGQDVMWLAAFNDALAYMRNSATYADHMNPRGFGVSIRRMS